MKITKTGAMIRAEACLSSHQRGRGDDDISMTIACLCKLVLDLIEQLNQLQTQFDEHLDLFKGGHPE